MGRLTRLALALDTPDWKTFYGWVERFGGRVGVVKVGLEAYVRWGARAVEVAKASGAALFLDLKLHDIPATVAGAVSAARDHGVDYLTVHASGGPAMLAAARQAAGPDGPKLLAVTLLTHLDEAALAALDLPGEPAARVRGWAALAREAGCAGIVCSAREAAALRAACARPFLLVTPGIRPAGAAADDQRRVATAEEALAAGADLLVVGRPLTRAADPEAALAAFAAAFAGQA